MAAEGPDRILPAENYICWEPEAAVKIRFLDEPPGKLEPTSLVSFVQKQCKAGGNLTALAVKRDGQWKKWTYNQYFKDIQTVAKGFLHLGLEHLKGVAIWGFNSPEWFIADVGAIYAGGVVLGLYPTNNDPVNKFILQDGRVDILVVEDANSVERILQFRNELPDLKKIVQYLGEPPRHPDVISWQELLRLGEEEQQHESVLCERHRMMAINQCAMYVYTSGTTGMPKGVMLSHDNVYWMAHAASTYLDLRQSTEIMISYLPLSHVAANMVDIWSPITTKGAIYFADKNALKGTLLETLKEVRPTVFLGVPRVWEKIMEGMLDKGKDIKGLKKKVAESCKKAGLEYHLEKKSSLMYTLGRKLIYGKIKAALGLDRCVSFFSGAAPLALEALRYFASIDIVICELYGLSETNGPQTLNFYGDKFKFGTVGKTLHGTKSKVAEAGPTGEGEICMWGRNVMMGYVNQKEKTLEVFDNEMYFMSGDLGLFDADNFLKITGRLKELIITAGAENIAPVPIEDAIKRELPCVSNAILIGDKRKFLSVFLTLKTVLDKRTELPTSKLTPTSIEWCKSVGSDATLVEEILVKPDRKVMEAIQAGIDRANRDALSNAAKVQRWTILPQDVTVAAGELGPTLKLKRFYFNKKYEDAIEKMYA